MTPKDYWIGWVLMFCLTFTFSMVVVRMLIVNPLLSRMDAIIQMGTRLQGPLQ